MKTAEDKWLTVRNMQERAQMRRSEHEAIVELSGPTYVDNPHEPAVPQKMQQQTGRSTKRAAMTA